MNLYTIVPTKKQVENLHMRICKSFNLRIDFYIETIREFKLDGNTMWLLFLVHRHNKKYFKNIIGYYPYIYNNDSEIRLDKIRLLDFNIDDIEQRLVYPIIKSDIKEPIINI